MIFTPEERKALLALLALLLLGQAVSLWEQHRRSKPDRELSAWLTRLSQARGDTTMALPDSTDGEASPPAEGAGPVRIEPAASIPPGVLATARVDINLATAEDLEGLPGIGPSLARKILSDRQARGPFRDPGDLLRVPGIGPKKLERLRDRILWGNATPDLKKVSATESREEASSSPQHHRSGGP